MKREISALVFDAYGTLFDVHSVTRLADSHFPGKGAALSAAWRTKQLEYTWLRSLMRRYEDFNRVTLAALEWRLQALGLEAEPAVRDALLTEYRRLAMFPGDDVGARTNLARWMKLRTPLDYHRVRQLARRWQPYPGFLYFHLLLQALDETCALGIGPAE